MHKPTCDKLSWYKRAMMPDLGRLCHYCATKNGSKQHKIKV